MADECQGAADELLYHFRSVHLPPDLRLEISQLRMGVTIREKLAFKLASRLPDREFAAHLGLAEGTIRAWRKSLRKKQGSDKTP